jgi:hypothetical protein
MTLSCSLTDSSIWVIRLLTITKSMVRFDKEETLRSWGSRTSEMCGSKQKASSCERIYSIWQLYQCSTIATECGLVEKTKTKSFKLLNEPWNSERSGSNLSRFFQAVSFAIEPSLRTPTSKHSNGSVVVQATGQEEKTTVGPFARLSSDHTTFEDKKDDQQIDSTSSCMKVWREFGIDSRETERSAKKKWLKCFRLC